MTPPPSPAAQIAALASLTGAPVDPSRDPDILRIGLIAVAKDAGLSWAQIGQCLLGVPDGKLARKTAHRLARDANVKLLRQGQPGVEAPQ